MQTAGYRTAASSFLFALVAMFSVSSAVVAQELPPGGLTSWEIRGPKEIVTFVLFDPNTPDMPLPEGLRFMSARDVGMPEVQEHLKKHPDQMDWAFSFVEIARDSGFLIDGKAPAYPENGAAGMWFAPVDPSGLTELVGKEVFETIIAPSLGSVVALGLWIPDQEYVAYMRTRGHHADFGMVTFVKDSNGTFHGEIRLENPHVRVSATPHAEVREDTESGTQVLFAPGAKVERAVVIAGSTSRHRACTATWSKSGSNHPLVAGTFVGPTYFTTYDAPLKGSAYRLTEVAKP